EGPPRRHATGLDPKRFALIAAVVDRIAKIPVGRMELYGGTAGGVRVDDPACDLAVAAAIASSVTRTPPPQGSAFVGEISLTGAIRPVAAMGQRVASAARTGISRVFGPSGDGAPGV